jgi:hypothetical protein
MELKNEKREGYPYSSSSASNSVSSQSVGGIDVCMIKIDADEQISMMI